MRYIWIVIILMWSPGLWAEMSMVSGKVLSIPHHKSAYVSLAGKASRVSLGDPEVLDIVMLKSNELFLIGKKLGTTNLMVWDRRGRLIDSIDIEVIHDLNSLKSKLYEFLPDEEIKVHSAKDRLILSYQISSQARMMQALRIAETYAAAQSVEQSAAGGVKALKASSEKKDDNPVVNLMTIGGAQRVMLEVSVVKFSVVWCVVLIPISTFSKLTVNLPGVALLPAASLMILPEESVPSLILRLSMKPGCFPHSLMETHCLRWLWILPKKMVWQKYSRNQI